MCKNDYILHRVAKYEDLDKFPICELDRFNRRKDDGDDKNCNKRECGPKRCFSTFL
jgi:hypothetical protein